MPDAMPTVEMVIALPAMANAARLAKDLGRPNHTIVVEHRLAHAHGTPRRGPGVVNRHGSFTT